MIILGLALAHGALSSEFSKGGVQETSIMSINNIFNIEGNPEYDLSERALNDDLYNKELDHEQGEEAQLLFRREHHDGSRIDSLTELNTAQIKRINDDEDFHDLKVINYSLDDTQTEQNSGPSDDNLSTAGGYLKKGISDPDANERKEQKKHAKQMVAQILSDQAKMAEYLANLEVRIAELESKLEEHNHEIAELENIQEALEGDINGGSPSARARRGKVQAWAKEKGVDLEKFKREDGSIDQEKLNNFVGNQKEEVIEQRDEVQKELTKLETKDREIRSTLNSDDNKYEAAIASGDKQAITEAEYNLETNSVQGSDYLFLRKTDEEKLAEYTSGQDKDIITPASLTSVDNMIGQKIFELKSNSLFSFPDITQFSLGSDTLEENPATNDDKIAGPLNHNLATFAANDDDKSTHNAVSKIFAEVSNPEIVAQQPNNDKQLEQNTYYNPAIYTATNSLG